MSNGFYWDAVMNLKTVLTESQIFVDYKLVSNRSQNIRKLKIDNFCKFWTKIRFISTLELVRFKDIALPILIQKLHTFSSSLWKFERITFILIKSISYSIFTMSRAKTADQSADLPKPVQKTVECLRYDRVFWWRGLTIVKSRRNSYK